MELITENKVEVQKLENGLTVKLIEKPNFQAFNVQLIVNFGSSNLKCGDVPIPPGSAHLMEHLLFHKKNYEIDSLFSKLGIDVNAYTTYNLTNFFYPILKKDSKYFQEALSYLFELVFDPYFSEQMIDKEIDIISSEIQIAEDDVDSDLYTDLLRKLYPNTPLGYDILGTKQSIKNVNLKLLKLIYNHFYQPQNMVLYVCGPISMKELLKVVSSLRVPENNIEFIEHKDYYYLPIEKKEDLTNGKLTKLIYGWSLPNLNLDYKKSVIFSLYLENMLGKRSHFFHKMYNESVINDDFYYEFVVEENFTVLFFSCLTEKPQQIVDTTWKTLHSYQISDEKFKVTVKNFIGKYIQSFDSISELSSFETDGKFHLEDAVNSLKVIEDIKIDQVIEIAKVIFKDSQFASAFKIIS